MSATIKVFKTYDEQVDLLVARGMGISDRPAAIYHLERINYYRLSGYWYPFRGIIAPGQRSDHFSPGAQFEDVIALYDFDARLRTATFDALTPVELALRAALGHTLGELHECAHLTPGVLSSRAGGESYSRWVDDYNKQLGRSREEFVVHHIHRYGGTLPVWVAVEILDWGSLTYLFDFAPNRTQTEIAGNFGLTAPQLRAWMKSLNVIRNTCAHHGRLFNRTHALVPKLPRLGAFPELDQAAPHMNRTFGQLTLIQHLRHQHGLPLSRMLAAVIRSYPDHIARVPVAQLGVWPDWQASPLWPT
ncbi:abortive infection bacteriophage resistance protein [Williamsia limnetica]|uniref:Abortive infection bacteriophage resistance protein n=1 Tax=Williamsia limnetica TaxID=882452 RepID=A0A318RIX6_WILLI|nr:Abi family protein [Williamsia limnetica]PYE13568.1 abortive infection bacteriophage resistance protein [Williamsia limnetica]